MTAQNITVFRTCTDARMETYAQTVQTISIHKNTARGFLNALKSAVSEYKSAVEAFGNMAGVSVWVQIGNDRIPSHAASKIINEISTDVADGRETSATRAAAGYLSVTGHYAQ